MIGYPGCLHRDKNGNERMIDLPTRLLCDRIVMVTGEVTDELAESVVAQLLYLESVDKDKPININFVIENLLNPEKRITIADDNKAPINPNTE